MIKNCIKNTIVLPRVRIFLLFCLLVAAVFSSVALGSVRMSLGQLFGGIFVRDGYDLQTLIIYNIRLPRTLAAVLGGCGLAVSGAVLQAVTENDLAAPSIIGINSGAGLSAMIFLAFVPINMSLVGNMLLQIFSFFGAFLTTIIVVSLANRAGGSKAAIVLAGVAVNAVFNALIGAVSLVDSDVLSSYNSFSIGGFALTEYRELSFPAVIIALSIVIALAVAPRINLLSIGSDGARILGVNVSSLRILCIIIASASASAAVSFSGLIGFVGLVAPHISKRLVGADAARCIPASAMIGALVTTVADLFGRILLPPTEIPVGIMMALLGAPFFMVLLFKERREYL